MPSTDTPPADRDLLAHLMIRIDAIEAMFIEDEAERLSLLSREDANAKLARTAEYVDAWRTDTAEQIYRRRRVRITLGLLLEYIARRANFPPRPPRW